MKRRTFIRRAGAGGLAMGLHPKLPPHAPAHAFSYPYPQTFQDALSQEGTLWLRLAISSTQPDAVIPYELGLQPMGAQLAEVRPYFFEPVEDRFDPATQSWQGRAALRGEDVLLVVLENPHPDARFSMTAGTRTYEVQLSQLLEEPEIRIEAADLRLTLNLLFDKEIGRVDPSSLNIDPNPMDFRLVLMADPQGGDPAEPSLNSPARMKVHNAFIEENIDRVNALEPQPAFVVVNGDFVDSQGQAALFDAMRRYYSRLQAPLLLELGNHETRYRSVFSPGYNMDAFENYFAAQKAINGLSHLLYSFNVGKWHFVIWPDPLRDQFWETHPHYFYWLEKDLEAHMDFQVMFIHHVPLHPIGINPLINYAEGVYVRRLILDLLAAHGKVQYIFSGHVHIPLKAALKTAVEYRGMKMLNLPPAGYRPRAFGEADLTLGPSQGSLVIDIEGEAAHLSFLTATGRLMPLSTDFRRVEDDDWPLWMREKWELPVNPVLVNGDWRSGFAAWHRRFVYREDEVPSNLCEIRRSAEGYALYQACRPRGFFTAGQDRLPQTLNRLCQVLALEPTSWPMLELRFRVDPGTFSLDVWAGAYIWIEGYGQSHKRFNLLYSLGRCHWDVGGKYSKSYQAGYDYCKVPIDPGRWQMLRLGIREDLLAAGKPVSEGLWDADRMVINLGVWTDNVDPRAEIGILWDSLSFLSATSRAQASTADGNPLSPVPEEEIWQKGIDHIAGEHVYIDRN